MADEFEDTQSVAEAAASPRRRPNANAAPLTGDQTIERLKRIAAQNDEDAFGDEDAGGIDPAIVAAKNAQSAPPLANASQVQPPATPPKIEQSKDTTVKPAFELPAGAVIDPFRLQEAGDDELITVHYEDTATDEWKSKEVPAGEVRQVITAQNMFDRAHEGLDRSALSSDMYDQNYTYYWGSAKEDCPTNVHLRKLGYRPVKDSQVHFHRTREVAGLGKVATAGDSVLFRVPRTLAEAREAQRLEKREKEKWEWNNKGVANLMSMVDGEDVMLIKKQSKTKMGVTTLGEIANELNQDRAMAAAEQLQKARAYAGMDPDTTNGRKSYGGFYNNAMAPGIPESPVFRNRQ